MTVEDLALFYAFGKIQREQAGKVGVTARPGRWKVATEPTGTLSQSIINSSCFCFDADGRISNACGIRREKPNPGLLDSTMCEVPLRELVRDGGVAPGGLAADEKTIYDTGY